MKNSFVQHFFFQNTGDISNAKGFYEDQCDSKQILKMIICSSEKSNICNFSEYVNTADSVHLESLLENISLINQDPLQRLFN